MMTESIGLDAVVDTRLMVSPKPGSGLDIDYHKTTAQVGRQSGSGKGKLA